MIWRNGAAGALLLLGLTQMTGDLLGIRVLRGLGAVSAVAPCPKVFCDMNGFEAFAADFTITLEEKRAISVSVTPELYSLLAGPYNRRNVYGAAIAAAPLLPEPIRRGVFNYAFGPGGPLRREMKLPEDTSSIGIMVREGTRGRHRLWHYRCTE